METLKSIIVYAAPLVAGFITSVVIPFIIKKWSVRKLEKRIDEISESEQLKSINNRLLSIERNIQEMRGKRK